MQRSFTSEERQEMRMRTDQVAYETIQAQRAARLEKTARLRRLRLAKEAEEAAGRIADRAIKERNRTDPNHT